MVKEFWKSVKFWQSYRNQLMVHFLGHNVFMWAFMHMFSCSHSNVSHKLYFLYAHIASFYKNETRLNNIHGSLKNKQL